LALIVCDSESSDGFASVGTILPKEEAALLPGGLFAVSGNNNDLKRKECEEKREVSQRIP